MNKIKNWIVKIFVPSAFKIGILITAITVYMAWVYYNQQDMQGKTNPFLQFLNQASLKSIDFRTVLRGPRYGSGRVAIIAVDEKAVEKLGRWPWPRGRIAQMIEELSKYNAKVIGFDAVFAEPDNNQAVISLSKIKQSGLATGPMAQMIESELTQANTDQALSEAVRKHGDRVVMGIYFDTVDHKYYPYQKLCDNLRVKDTQAYKAMMNEDHPVAALDNLPEELNPFFAHFIEAAFAQITKTVTEKFGIIKNDQEKIDLENEITNAKTSFCDNWLIESKDSSWNSMKSAWSEVQKQDPNLASVTFEDFVENFKSSIKQNEVTDTGRWWTNLGLITQNTKNSAYFNAFLDNDGTIRSSHLIVRNGDQYISSLATKAAMMGLDYGLLLKLDENPIDPNSKTISQLSFTDSNTGEPVYDLPVDGSGKLAINYAGPGKMFAHMSVYELFNSKDTAEIEQYDIATKKVVLKTVKKADFIKDKIFIFGATATGIYDLRVTPFAENYPGVETHANLVDNLIRRDFLVHPQDEGPKMLATLIVLGLILSFALSHMGAVAGLTLTATVLLGVHFVDSIFLFSHGQVYSVLLPVLLVLGLYVSLTFYKYLTEERNKKALKGTFQKYVSPAIVEEVLKNPDNIKLGGRKERMTVLFSDIRGFTTISEKLSPEALSNFLNSYLTPMTELVFKNKGTLDKYMGDAVMAFFGAPISYPDHAKMACHCALQMMKKLDELKPIWEKQGLPPLDIGIGMNTGDMSVGNMGSETVRSYTVMGDSVNLGSRLEGINKEYGTHIMISEFTQNDVKDAFITREVDWVKVKGKLQPVRIFELVGEKGKVDEKKINVLASFNEGFQFYHNKDFNKARACFEKCVSIDSQDGPSKLYLERTSDYIAEPPPENWDGVFTMKTK